MPERCKHATLWRRAAMELTKDADYKTQSSGPPVRQRDEQGDAHDGIGSSARGPRTRRSRSSSKPRSPVCAVAHPIGVDRSGLCRAMPRRRPNTWRPICAASASRPACARPAGHPVVIGKSGNGRAANVPAPARRASCSTAIMTCSRSIRSICGRRRRSSRASRRSTAGARSSSPAAPATTKARP